MKKSLIAVAGALVGASLIAASPAMAHDHIAFGVSVGVPVAPVGYVAPAPIYVPPPVPVGPAVVVGAPVVGVGFGPYYHGYYGYHGYYHGYYGYHGGYHGWHR